MTSRARRAWLLIAGVVVTGGLVLAGSPQVRLALARLRPWSLPVWRADGRAMLLLTTAELVLDGPESCSVVGEGLTSAAFVGEDVAQSDGRTVWIHGEPRWQGTNVRLMMAAGAAWLLSNEGFGEVTADGVRILEPSRGLATVWEMPHGVCLVDDSMGDLVLVDPPWWGSECWHPGSGTSVRYPRGLMPVDVDLVNNPDTGSLLDAATDSVRVLPSTFPVTFTTRVLPNGTLRSFEGHGYVELGVDDVVREVRWGEPHSECATAGCPTWRSTAEL